MDFKIFWKKKKKSRIEKSDKIESKIGRGNIDDEDEIRELVNEQQENVKRKLEFKAKQNIREIEESPRFILKKIEDDEEDISTKRHFSLGNFLGTFCEDENILRISDIKEENNKSKLEDQKKNCPEVKIEMKIEKTVKKKFDQRERNKEEKKRNFLEKLRKKRRDSNLKIRKPRKPILSCKDEGNLNSGKRMNLMKKGDDFRKIFGVYLVNNNNKENIESINKDNKIKKGVLMLKSLNSYHN